MYNNKNFFLPVWNNINIKNELIKVTFAFTL